MAALKDKKYRCEWCLSSEGMVSYHDFEWGVPLHDDVRFFEAIVLDGMQAGLSWSTILKKREAFRKAFAGFVPEKVARFTHKKVESLMQDSGIVRNRLKIESAISNAKAFLKVKDEFGSFDDYIWRFVGGKPIVNSRKSLKDIPCSSKESDAMSRDLVKRGFKFVGTKICYAFMQAAGMVNDHVTSCFRYKEVAK